MSYSNYNEKEPEKEYMCVCVCVCVCLNHFAVHPKLTPVADSC